MSSIPSEAKVLARGAGHETVVDGEGSDRVWTKDMQTQDKGCI